MVEENNKIIAIIIVIFITLALTVTLMFIDIPALGTCSIKSIISQNSDLKKKESELAKLKSDYTLLDTTLETAKKSFDSEKAKYEAISEDTINVIKEMNTDENYSLEYMWIKLGNYALKNNLTLVMVEPGNTKGDLEKQANNSDSTNSNEKSVTKDESVVASSENKEESNKTNSSSGVLQIQVTGSYMNLSDFVYDVESDTELKFKLDNIKMEKKDGTDVTTTFDVKNVIINR